MSPADLLRESARFDLPIAIGILAASGQVPAGVLERFEFAGELSVGGELRPVLGCLAMALAASKSIRDGRARRVFLAPENADEAALVGRVPILAARNLREVVAHLAAAAGQEHGRALPDHFAQVRLSPPSYPDFCDVKGQTFAKRALEIAAAGGHSVLLVGAPGSGKTMLAQRFAGLLAPMDSDEAMESAAVLSLVGKFAPQRWATRVFRAPHHNASVATLVGGGADEAPGEVTLAHQGVLFLDELPEFDRRVLDSLREPLESGRVSSARGARQVEYPARFQLLSAMQPCPCGNHGHPSLVCRCTPEMVSRYQDRISGPLLERIDMRVEVAALGPEALACLPEGEWTHTLAERVARARRRAIARQGKPNDELTAVEIEQVCRPEGPVRQLLHAASARLGWSARAYHRVLKLARSIADFEGEDALTTQFIAESIQYRRSLRET
jgi:magnesium chelatase family protein